MTLARLDLGSTERLGNSTIWRSVEPTEGEEGINISAVLRDMNQELRRDHTVFQLHAADFDVHFYGNRYDIIGGAARRVFRRLQGRLLEHCAGLGECAVGC